MSIFNNLPSFPDLAFIELPAMDLAGLKVRTSLAFAQRDCPALWTAFQPRMFELSCKDSCLGFQGESYGVSVPVNVADGVFDYWAAMPVQPGEALPEGMSRLTLAPALYAACAVPSLAELGAAFNYIYREWATVQTAYSLSAAPSLERYGEHYFKTGALDVLAPVLRKV